MRRAPFELYKFCKDNKVIITLGGRHAFEWCIGIQTPKRVETIILPNRTAALAEFKRQKQKYKFGDIYS